MASNRAHRGLVPRWVKSGVPIAIICPIEYCQSFFGISVTPTTDFFQCAIASYADIVVVQGAHHNAGSRYVYIGTRHPPSFKS